VSGESGAGRCEWREHRAHLQAATRYSHQNRNTHSFDHRRRVACGGLGAAALRGAHGRSKGRGEWAWVGVWNWNGRGGGAGSGSGRVEVEVEEWPPLLLLLPSLLFEIPDRPPLLPQSSVGPLSPSALYAISPSSNFQNSKQLSPIPEPNYLPNSELGTRGLSGLGLSGLGPGPGRPEARPGAGAQSSGRRRGQPVF
jgi:hypothetical protein